MAIDFKGVAFGLEFAKLETDARVEANIDVHQAIGFVFRKAVGNGSWEIERTCCQRGAKKCGILMALVKTGQRRPTDPLSLVVSQSLDRVIVDAHLLIGIASSDGQVYVGIESSLGGDIELGEGIRFHIELGLRGSHHQPENKRSDAQHDNKCYYNFQQQL